MAKFHGVGYRYRRGSADAVSDITISFGQEPTLILGVNGAGKSTLLRLISRQLTPNEGRIEDLSSCSLVTQSPVAVRGLTVLEQVAYASWLKGVPSKLSDDMVAEAMSVVDIADLADRRTTQLSGGQLARLGIACGLVGEDGFLLLDEPSASLDPLARRAVHESLSRIVEQGIALVATSHTAADLDEPFSRVVVLDQGRIAHDGPRRSFLSDEHEHPVVRDLSLALRPKHPA